MSSRNEEGIEVSAAYGLNHVHMLNKVPPRTNGMSPALLFLQCFPNRFENLETNRTSTKVNRRTNYFNRLAVLIAGALGLLGKFESAL